MLIMLLWIAILGVPLLIYLGAPIWSRHRRFPELDYAESRMQSLYLERQRSYEALADLDEDYEAGKLSEADYQTLRGQLLQETAAIVAQLETVGMASVEEEIERYKQEKQTQG
jgi:hypothetical protein